MFVGEAVMEMEPLNFPVLTWTMINVKTIM